MCDAVGEGIGGTGKKNRLFVDANFALIARMNAAQDLHESALAGTVFADHRDDFSGQDRHGNRVQGDHPAEPLGNGSCLYNP